MPAVLQVSKLPEPLGVDLVGHSSSEAIFLVRAVVDACERRGSPLSLIRVAMSYGAIVSRTFGPGLMYYEGVKIALASELNERIEFHRFLPS